MTMATHLHLSSSLKFSLTSLHRSPFHCAKLFTSSSSSHLSLTRTHCAVRASSFTWDDVARISQPNFSPSDPSDLNGFFDKIRICNRNLEMESKFIPFAMEDKIVGYLHERLRYSYLCPETEGNVMLEKLDHLACPIIFFSDQLRKFRDVFVFPEESSSQSHISRLITLNPMLETPEDRTIAIGNIVNYLGEKVFPGIRNELYPVASSFGTPIYFSLERAAAPYFGIRAYGIHMNGYVERDGEKFLWLAKRSQTKPTYPGMLDHLVAGGLPHGIACGENVIKECEEEAGIPRSIAKNAIPVGAVSYRDIDGYRYKRDILFCYDLRLPDDFTPTNQDGEVESFKLMPVSNVATVIRRTKFFKQNCPLVIIDFLIRHGYIKPEEPGYLELLRSLRSGDCS